jgi:pectinesterase
MRSLLLLALTATLSAQDVHVRLPADFPTIQQALDHAPETPGRTIISIAPGIYHERVIVTRNHPRITLLGLGKSPADTVITASQNAASAGGTFLSATVEIDGDAFEADNITFQNDAPPPGPVGGQAVAIAVRSDRAIFKRCRFLGDQDTLFADFGRQYYLDSFIAGGVDFIFGNATALFDHSEIHIIRPGYLTAQSRTAPDQTTGYVITNSKVTRSMCLRDEPECYAPWAGNFYLGRPWRPYSRVIVMNTELPASLNPEGWSLWHKDDPVPPSAYYAEFHNTGPGADTSHRAPWSHQLTPAETAAYTPLAFLSGSDSWNPLTEAAALP